MASRTWNSVDSSLWDEDWSDLAIGMAAQLISLCPNQYGVYDLPIKRLRAYWATFSQSPEAIALALDELEQAGFIQRFDAGRKVWLVKKFKRHAARILTDLHRKGVAAFISQFPEIEPAFVALYLSCYEIKPKLDVIEIPSRLNLDANRLRLETKTKDEDQVSTPTKRKESKTPATPPNKLRAPTERERQLFPLVEVLGKIINDGRAERRLAPVTQNVEKSAVTLRQCYDRHGLQPKQLIALAQWMFGADNRDLDFNTANLSYLHNWRKPWANGVAVICKYEEFLKWLQKQAV